MSIRAPRSICGDPDTGVYYASADPDVVTGVLHKKRQRQQRLARSPFYEFPKEWAADPSTLPCRHPRIAFRRIARATDSRTTVAALVPPGVVLTDVAPYFLFVRGTARDEAYLLGVLSSIPLDWCARRVVETHMDFHVVNALPVPRPGEITGCAGALRRSRDGSPPWTSATPTGQPRSACQWARSRRGEARATGGARRGGGAPVRARRGRCAPHLRDVS